MAEQSAARKTPPAPATDQRRREKALQGIAGYLADSRAREFDRLVYERVRLGILSALAVNPTLTFSELKKLLQTSDGNLSVHARKLEDAGYVSCKKTFDGRVPRSEYRLRPKGRRALERYLDHMEALIGAVGATGAGDGR